MPLKHFTTIPVSYTHLDVYKRQAMGYPFEKDYVKINLEILSNLSADATTSMQRDIMEGKPSELDGLVMEPLRLAKKYSVSMPCYEEVAKVLCPLEF